jgi:hypothetical protein
MMGHTDYAFTASRYTHKDLDFYIMKLKKLPQDKKCETNVIIVVAIKLKKHVSTWFYIIPVELMMGLKPAAC